MTNLKCWAVGPRDVDGMSRFCQKPRHHEGECAFVRDRLSRHTVAAAPEQKVAAPAPRPRQIDLGNRLRRFFLGGGV